LQDVLDINPEISLTACTVFDEKRAKISFSTLNSIDAYNFDEELRKYFDFPYATYRDSEKSRIYSLDLVLK
jgi:hypothetical protein